MDHSQLSSYSVCDIKAVLYSVIGLSVKMFWLTQNLNIFSCILKCLTEILLT